MPRYKIIVNPLAGKGHAAQVAEQVRTVFTAMDVPFDLAKTSRAGEAVQMAQQAVLEGYDVLVAVGGDGTTHEVINGMLNSGNGSGCDLAIIPAGSGNDFAAINQIPTDIGEACRLVVQGKPRLVDIGHIEIDGNMSRYFDNTVGIGLDGLVTIETRKLPWLRGIPLYLLALLKSVFIHLKPMRVEMEVDGVVIQHTTLMVSIANGQREGGGFLIAPQASPDDGHLDLLFTNVLPRIKVLGMIPLFLQGKHLAHEAIHIREAQHIVITSDDPLYYHVDGELPGGAAHKFNIQVIPGRLRLISR